MTNGEKMLWAAAYSKQFKFDIPGYVHQEFQEWRQGVRLGPDPWEAYEIGQAASAAEYATGVVTRLRSALSAVAEGFGEDSDVYQMIKEMLGKEGK